MKVILAALLIAFIAVAPGEAWGSSVKAYFNGREATVSGVVLRVGEPFTIDLHIDPDVDSTVWVMLVEPGQTMAYDRVGGDLKGVPLAAPCIAGDRASFRWELAANERWAGGSAPANIFYQIEPRGMREASVPGVSGYFTVVDAYIARAREPVASPQATAPSVSAPWHPATCIAGFAAAAAVKARCSRQPGPLKKYLI